MSDEKLLTVREVAQLLRVSEKDVMDLAEKGAMPAYKVGGVYVRFKKEQVYEYQKKYIPSMQKAAQVKKGSVPEAISDFFYFNDFYILASLLVIVLLTIILKG